MRVLWREIRERRRRPDFEAIIKEVNKTLDAKVKPEVLAYFNNRIMRYLNLDVTFKAKKQVTKEEIIVYVYPTGPDKDIWKILSVTGSGLYGPKKRKYEITPKGEGYPLRFPWGGYGSYKPKTTTAGGYKGPGTVTNPQIVRFMRVMHPGIRPRRFEKHVGRWYRKKFVKHIENAMRRATRRAA
jgi:hypothetical protein